MVLCDFSFYKLRLVLWPTVGSIMENALCVLKKNMYSAALDGLVCICLLLGSIGLKYSSNIGSMFPY